MHATWKRSEGQPTTAKKPSHTAASDLRAQWAMVCRYSGNSSTKATTLGSRASVCSMVDTTSYESCLTSYSEKI